MISRIMQPRFVFPVFDAEGFLLHIDMIRAAGSSGRIRHGRLRYGIGGGDVLL
jgi:hypothetical protein